MSVHCEEKCAVEYHLNCWKQCKATQYDKRSDKVSTILSLITDLQFQFSVKSSTFGGPHFGCQILRIFSLKLGFTWVSRDDVSTVNF